MTPGESFQETAGPARAPRLPAANTGWASPGEGGRGNARDGRHVPGVAVEQDAGSLEARGACAAPFS